MLVALTCMALAACGGHSASHTPAPAPEVTLTPDEEEAWAPLPPDRSAVPVLLYHGIGPASDFSNSADAEQGVDADDFAKQMTLMHHAGYQTIGLQTFIDFVEGRPVELPPRPLLLTFDDARANSWTGADGILRELHYTAVMFVDVGRVNGRYREYMTWDELQTAQDSGRWQLQLHSGKGHTQIKYGPGDDDYGPFYAYKKEGEDFAGWQKRAEPDIEWGQTTLADHIPEYRPLAFAPPYGNYGQDGTNDDRIPRELLPWLKQRYGTIFTQDRNARADPGSEQPLGRIVVTRTETAGALREKLLAGE